MLYLVNYRERQKEYTDLITEVDLKSCKEPEEFYNVREVNSYIDLVKQVEDCSVIYKDIEYLLAIGKDCFTVADCLKNVLTATYISPKELESAVIKALEEQYKGITYRNFNNKTCLHLPKATIEFIYSIKKEQDGYKIKQYNFL